MTRRVSTVMLAACAMLLVSAMAAYACTNLATLNLSEGVGAAGADVDVTGSAFAAGEDAPEVEIRWDGSDGSVLATAQPDGNGAIATSVTIPDDAEPGYHVLVATQMLEGDDGEASPAFGTPARATFRVGQAGQPAEISEQPAAPTGATPAASTPTGLIALGALLSLGGLALFGAGLGLFVRQNRRRVAGQPAPVRRE